MSLIVCVKCGEKCRDYDLFCPRCGSPCRMKQERDCDGNCEKCPYDMPFGCGKPKHMPYVSPYPHTIVEKDNAYYYVEESEKRSRLGVVLLALMATGALGIHDFYGRYYLRGILHILLIILGMIFPWLKIGRALLISWGIAVVEAILVTARVIKTDGKGYPFD